MDLYDDSNSSVLCICHFYQMFPETNIFPLTLLIAELQLNLFMQLQIFKLSIS